MTSYEEQIIKDTADYIKDKLEGEGSGHDWWHIYRVWQLAKHISMKEGADTFKVELGALLHDIADWKFNEGDEKAGGREAKKWLQSIGVTETIYDEVAFIVDNVSFKGAKVENTMKGLEGMIVQDADRLDAIGAIGIARTFAYGGFKQREMYNPDIKPEIHESFEAYKNSNSNTINHFYEKLLFLKDMMNTKTAKAMAEERHKYMEGFLKEFFEEWEGNK
ncbi:HD domain-containing protein [Desnuesiella massiliensis]|uniref:HD domain-containing protein n=1 Tax=Desnuesiella massiliensis TaxID=1650662 RepID=UPI0006E1F4A5|nr:HD domain-containing protein [Desnuesiella massiliensis]